MKKSFKKINLGKKTVYRTTLTGEEIVNQEEKRVRQWTMLQTLANTPELMNCGPVTFDSLRMSFVGEAWVVEMEAAVVEA